VGDRYTTGVQPVDMDPIPWLELFHTFTTLQGLTIPAMLEPSIPDGLQRLTGESAVEVFPALESLSTVGSVTDKAT
jgi:hypothetical protein